jgi:hypothetical protein
VINIIYLEDLRDKLYESIERGTEEEILNISQELDEEIIRYIQEHLKSQFRQYKTISLNRYKERSCKNGRYNCTKPTEG